MTELKPCPFCGGEVTVARYDNWWSVIAKGTDPKISCRCRVFMESELFHNDAEKERAKENLIETWNTRPNPWHTGTPTEEGNYIAHLRIKSRDGEFIEYDMTCNLEVLLNYIRCQDESEENYLMVKGWLRYEPYKEN